MSEKQVQIKSPVLIIDEYKPESYKYYVFPTPLEGPQCGILLADAARHFAKAISKQANTEYGKVLHEIIDFFNKEINKPTAILKGGVIEDG